MVKEGAKQIAVIRFPEADYTERAVRLAARKSLPESTTLLVMDVQDGEAAERLCEEHQDQRIVFFSDYDILPFDALLRAPDRLLCSSYIIRKALIRKHYLAHALHAYRLKQDPEAKQQPVTPTTWPIEINYADELDELLMDDLYDLNAELEQNVEREAADQKWFILKPAMADRGNGIRLFASLDQLRTIFEEFEGDDEDQDEDEDAAAGQSHDNDTAVMTSQLRHFVIQEYISSPLLLSAPSGQRPTSARKFHLRAYVLCVGGLKVYLADEMLALFAPLPYSPPGVTANDTTYASDDLRRHLTNTCLQSEDKTDTSRVSEENVFLFSELEGMSRSSDRGNEAMTRAELDTIKGSVVDVLAQTFTACATAGSIHWQMWPNAFEVFGIDLLVESVPERERTTDSSSFKVWLLEINAQPDFAQTGSRLEPTIEHLFGRVFDLAVLPFLSPDESKASIQPAIVGQSADGITLCLQLQLSNAWT
ncbi:hypothetical protein V8E36_004622 [Tilletia maclaganii]